MTSKRDNVTSLRRKRNVWCSACLCRKRNLYSLGKYRQIFELLSRNTDSAEHEIMDIIDYNYTFLCWECISLLRRVRDFQKMVQKSQNILRRSINEHSLSGICFSNLNISEMIILDTFEEEKEIKPCYTAKDDDDDDDDDCKNENELPNPQPILVDLDPNIKLNTEYTVNKSNEHKTNKFSKKLCPIKRENQINKKTCALSKSKKRKKQKIRNYPNERNRQYIITYQSLKREEAVQKIPINNVDLNKWIENERDCEHYKSLKNKCHICLRKLKLKESIKSHIENCHTASKHHPFGCDICNKYFTNKYQLKCHIKRHYYIHHCMLCGYESYSQLHMSYHLRKTHQKTVACLQCEERFKNTRDFFVHLKSHEVKYYFCDQCGKRARSLAVLEKHITRHHTDQRCEKCDMKFKSNKTLALHNKQIHTRGPSEHAFCVPCDKQFDTVRAYRTHLLNAAAHQAERGGKRKEKKVPCPICLKIFCRKETMMNHYRWVHTHDHKYKCEQCGKAFLNRTKYKDHMQYVHMGLEKPKSKICKLCNTGFTTNQILAHHILTHTGERPHLCPHCPQRFRQHTALNTHIKRAHRNKHDEVYIVVPYEDDESA